MTEHTPRCVALVGPYGSGKTTLMEAMLHGAGVLDRRGVVTDGNTVGDPSPEARARGMSVELTPVVADYLGERWTLLDCPGSVEFTHDATCALMAADVAVVVVEPDPERVVAAQPLLRFLDAHNIPHLIFVNKIETASVPVRAVLDALQDVSDRPLLLREVPIREGEAITGFVDVVSERAWRFEEGKPSRMISLPGDMADEEQAAREALLESLADFDDALMEQILEDATPSTEEIYAQLSKDLHEDLIVPVFLGSGFSANGITRLWKALRHEAPEVAETAARLGLDAVAGDTVARVFKCLHVPHAGKLAFTRVFRGALSDSGTVAGNRVGGLLRPFGARMDKIDSAAAGEVVALARMDDLQTGQILTTDTVAPATDWPAAPEPVLTRAISVDKRGEEVKLTGVLAKLCEDDPSLRIEQDAEMQEIRLAGQGEIHLAVALERLKDRYNLGVTDHPARVPYRETIRKGTKQHSRYKRQTGGHGQFGDVHIEITPLSRGEGFRFSDSIVGGAIPKNYIPAVEAGIKEYLQQGPLGFPVVDVAVNLYDGSFHSVDSSEMAFKTAGRIAMTEAMPACDPVLLEPILAVTVSVPQVHTPKAQRIISQRRGQILAFDAKPDWKGWDEVQAYLPQAEMDGLIIELRSLTQGAGFYTARFDHLQELSGRNADDVVARRKAELNG